MKTLITLLTFFALIPHLLLAQTYSKEFGKVGKDEVELQSCNFDKSAEAIVLFDIAKSRFVDTDKGLSILFERATRIKIFAESGLNWAEIEVPFYTDGDYLEEVTDIEASTYNFEDGQLTLTKLDPSQCQVEKINKYWSNKKFALPNVKPGSIIEYRYKIHTPDVFKLHDWEFQWKIPNMYSEYQVLMTPFYTYTWLLQGASKFDYQSTEKQKGLPRYFAGIEYYELNNTFVMKDIPAFKDEEFITSINDYIMKIDFQLSKIYYPSGSTRDIQTTWPKMVEDLLKSEEFGKYLKKSAKAFKKVISPDSILNKSDQEKFNYVLNYVKANYNWNKIRGKYTTKTVNELMKEKVGSCADINLFTIGLLNAAGIEAYPVIISTRDNGKIKYDYPFSHFFNYVIVMARFDNKTILSDATEILCANDRIPTRCINDKGLIIKDGDVEWTILECNYASTQQMSMQINKIDTVNLTQYVKIQSSTNEYLGLYMRNNYGENIEKIKEHINEDEGITLIDSTIVVKNQLDKKKSYILTYDVAFPVEKINGKIYLSPFLSEIMSDNPLKQNSRSYPIDMTYPERRVYSSTIEIPEGYKLDFVPAGTKTSDKLVDMEYNVVQNENKIVITFGYCFKKSVYAAEDYGKLKFYFNQIVRKGSEKVVLSKI
jgi:transglutaminase-like putative cysteine protease